MFYCLLFELGKIGVILIRDFEYVYLKAICRSPAIMVFKPVKPFNLWLTLKIDDLEWGQKTNPGRHSRGSGNPGIMMRSFEIT
jgi:hypothetical protein